MPPYLFKTFITTYLPLPNKPAMTQITIYCLPHAGGGAHSYMTWQSILPETVHWKPIELSGHFSRSNEPLYTSFEDAVDDIFKQIAGQLNGHFALFGHSMGGALAYEVALRFEALLPECLLRHVVISSVMPPHLRRTQTAYYRFTDESFKNHLAELGALSKDLMAHEMFVQGFLPSIRADYEIFERYKRHNIESLKSDLTVFYGNKEFDICSHMPYWKLYSQGNVHIKEFSGGHFYMQSQLKDVVQEVALAVISE